MVNIRLLVPRRVAIVMGFDIFGPSMGMLMARGSAGRGTLGLRAMLSLDPAAVGTRGYPLLLQTGETADGQTPLSCVSVPSISAPARSPASS